MNCEGPDCEDALKRLYLFLDHEIATGDCDQIQAHLDGCPDCMDEYSAEVLVKSLIVRSCAETAPEVLRERVLFAIRKITIETDISEA
ncbi:MAG: mycothiol system anti-sigma-R factor [Aeromicrobium sp.]|nr:MAG: mycothiol system anti-sigma-R factor [Aeromicrobium sp.]